MHKQIFLTSMSPHKLAWKYWFATKPVAQQIFNKILSRVPDLVFTRNDGTHSAQRHQIRSLPVGSPGMERVHHFPSSKSVLCAKLLIIQCLLVVILRLTVNPLKLFPGPLSAKITNGYGGFYALKRRLHLETYKNHIKYGAKSRSTVESKSTDLRNLEVPL